MGGTWENNAIVARWQRDDPWAVKYAEERDFWEEDPIAESKDIWIIGMTPFLDGKPGVPHAQRFKGLTAKSSDRGRTRNLFLNRSQKGFLWEKSPAGAHSGYANPRRLRFSRQCLLVGG